MQQTLEDVALAETLAMRMADKALKNYINMRIGQGLFGGAIVFTILFFVQFLMSTPSCDM